MVHEQALKQILFFGFLGYIRKAGKWYFKPYQKNFAMFGASAATNYTHSDLSELVKDVTERICTEPVAG